MHRASSLRIAMPASAPAAEVFPDLSPSVRILAWAGHLDGFIPGGQGAASRLGRDWDRRAGLFIRTQREILVRLHAYCRRTLGGCAGDAAWLADVVRDFMAPLVEALRELASRRDPALFGDPGSHWARRFSALRPVVPIAGYPQRALNARDMAETHIVHDLRHALQACGTGRDEVWRGVGGVVEGAIMDILGPGPVRMAGMIGVSGLGFDVIKMRNRVRDEVMAQRV